MIDEKTKNQLRVLTDEIAGPYLRVTLGQLPRIRDLLDRHEVHYWVQLVRDLAGS